MTPPATNLPARCLGGLAVAFGLWAALSTALAEPAVAAPVGSAPAAPGRLGTADSTANGERGPRAGTPDRSRVSAKPAPARRSQPESAPPKAAAAVPAVGRAAARVAAPQPIRRPVRAPVAEREPIPQPVSQPVPVTPSANSVPSPLSTSVGRRITIYKGTHFVIPNRWAVWITKDSGGATFTADSAYDLKDEDQLDWNKLAGITFTPWRPDRNSSMVVWRYNLQSGAFEIGPFFNVDFRYVFPTKDEVITVPVNETFSYYVDYDGITVSYGDRTVYKATPAELTPNFWTSARVTGWFGGSEVAPRTISYFQHA